jgi:hypothetical protein
MLSGSYYLMCTLRIQLPCIQERGDAAKLFTLNNSLRLSIETLQQMQVFLNVLLSVWGYPVQGVHNATGITRRKSQLE